MNSRRLSVIAGACGLLLTAGTAAATTAQASQRAGYRTDTGSSVTVATYNTEYGRSADTVVAELKRIATDGADVIGLQEMGVKARRDAVRAQMIDCAGCKWAALMTDLPEQNATPILYRSATFSLQDSGTKKVSERTYVGSSGAGPSTLKAKYVNWVLLRHRATGRLMYVLNNHAVPSVQGADGGPNTKNPERLELYRQHMAGLRSLIAELHATGAAVFVTGDFNVNYRRDVVLQPRVFPYHNLDQVNVAASYRRMGMPRIGTHGSGDRLIDYVHHLKRRGTPVSAQRVLTGYGSDHRPVLASYRIKR